MLLIALAVAGCAGYFSVWGLSQLFAGASTAVIIMASILEIGKVVTTTALHRYWDKISKTLKVYLTISVGVLMIITSAGIYGFLSNAYQKTADKLEIHEGEVGILTTKIETFKSSINDNKSIIAEKTKEKSETSNRLNKRIDNIDFTKSSQSKRADMATNESNKRIAIIDGQIDDLNVKNSSLMDSVNKYNIMLLNLKSNNKVSGEVGPLKYISELTGQPMAKVVNFLILLLIFVFDPLAIALILITNRVFEIEKEVVVEGATEGVNEGVNDTANDAVKDEVITDEVEDEGVIEEVNEGVNADIEEVKEEIKVEPEKPIIPKKEPVKVTGKIELEDIKEIKDRGYSVSVPQPKNSNTIERIGSNKIVKNGDNNTVFFKKN